MAYTFSTELVSDLHKDAFGHRPDTDFWDMWNNGLSDEGRQAEWDYMVKAVEQSINEEKRIEEAALVDFERELAAVRAAGKGVDESTALCWMTPIEFEENSDLNSQDIEHWVWQQGILFTERGRNIVGTLKEAYGVK